MRADHLGVGIVWALPARRLRRSLSLNCQSGTSHPQARTAIRTLSQIHPVRLTRTREPDVRCFSAISGNTRNRPMFRVAAAPTLGDALVPTARLILRHGQNDEVRTDRFAMRLSGRLYQPVLVNLYPFLTMMSRCPLQIAICSDTFLPTHDMICNSFANVLCIGRLISNSHSVELQDFDLGPRVPPTNPRQ